MRDFFKMRDFFHKIKILTGRFLTNHCEITIKVTLAVTMYPCNCCKVVFKEKSSLLRHISHKPLCKKYYGEEKVNDMRREARLASKRKWKNDHSEQEKEKYQSQKEKYRKYHQDRYVNAQKMNKSKEGETFQKLYMAAYSKAERILWDKLYDGAFEKINDNAIEQALDNTFESSGFQKLFNKNVGFHYDEDGDAAYEKDCDVYEEIEKAIEDTYERKYDEKIEELALEWIRTRELNITVNCLEKCKRKAFTKHFNEFESRHFDGIEDMAMDDAFLVLLSKDAENLEKVEWHLEENYRSSFQNGVKKFEETDFFNTIVNMIYNVIYEEHKKLNKSE